MTGRGHFLAVLVTLSSLLFMLRLVRVRKLRAKYALLWLLVGTGMIVLAASPGLLDRVSLAVGILSGPNTLFLAANVLLILVSMHFSFELSRLEERTRLLAEELALMKAEGDRSAPT